MTPDQGFKRLSESKIHQGFMWHLATAEFESPDGEVFSRDIVRSPGAVGVLPLLFDSEGVASVVLVRSSRYLLECAISKGRTQLTLRGGN